MTRAAPGLVVVLLLTACTGSDDAPVDDAAAPTTTAAPTAPPPATSAPSAGSDPDEPADEPAGGATTSLPQADAEGQSTGPLGDTEVKIETSEGSFQLGDAELPDEVDEAFPVPDDFDVDIAATASSDLGFSGTTALELDELVEFYTDGLTEAGYTVTTLQSVEGVVVVLNFERPGLDGQIALTASGAPDRRTVLVTMGAGDDEPVPDGG